MTSPFPSRPSNFRIIGDTVRRQPESGNQWIKGINGKRRFFIRAESRTFSRLFCVSSSYAPRIKTPRVAFSRFARSLAIPGREKRVWRTANASPGPLDRALPAEPHKGGPLRRRSAPASKIWTLKFRMALCTGDLPAGNLCKSNGGIM